HAPHLSFDPAQAVEHVLPQFVGVNRQTGLGCHRHPLYWYSLPLYCGDARKPVQGADFLVFVATASRSISSRSGHRASGGLRGEGQSRVADRGGPVGQRLIRFPKRIEVAVPGLQQPAAEVDHANCLPPLVRLGSLASLGRPALTVFNPAQGSSPRPAADNDGTGPLEALPFKSPFAEVLR